jgi:hypothetical protein
MGESNNNPQSELISSTFFWLSTAGGVLCLAGVILGVIGYLASPSWGDGNTDAGRVLRFLDESIKPLLAGSALLLSGLLLINMALKRNADQPT